MEEAREAKVEASKLTSMSNWVQQSEADSVKRGTMTPVATALPHSYSKIELNAELKKRLTQDEYKSIVDSIRS